MTNRHRPAHLPGRPISASTYTNYGCRCVGCTDDHRRQHRDWRQRASREARINMNKRKTTRVRRQNEHIKGASINHRRPWTLEDKAVALDPALTLRQAATRLGRTIYAIKYLRNQHRGG